MDGGAATGGVLKRLLAGLGRILLFLVVFLAISLALTLVIGPFVDEETDAQLIWGAVITSIGAVAAGIFMLRRFESRPAGALGIAWTSQSLREWVVGLGIGVGALAVAAATMAAAGGLSYFPDEGSAIDWAAITATGLGGLAIAAFGEEALFRGYPFQVLVRTTGAAFATLAASALFAVAHAMNPNVDGFALLNIFLAGILLSVAYLRTRSLWFATAVHLGWNWSMALLFDLPVSGLEIYDTPLYEPDIGGPRWFTGGSFGPEGGLVGSLAFAVALVAVLKVPGIGEPPELARLRPVVDDGRLAGEAAA